MTYFESVAGQNAVEHIANAIGEIAARMQQQNEILLRIEQRLKEQPNNREETQKMLAWSGREPDVPDQEGGHEQDRFTKRLSDGQAVMDCQKCEADWTAKHGKPLVQCTALYCRNRCKDRLADYEDAEDALKKSGGHNLYPHA